MGVAEGEQLALRERGHGVRALEPLHGAGHGVAQRLRIVGDQRGDQLGVRGRRELHIQPAAQLGGIDEIAVVADGDGARGAVLDDRLRVHPLDAAGRRVAGVADRELTLEAADVLLAEDLRDEAELAEDG